MVVTRKKLEISVHHCVSLVNRLSDISQIPKNLRKSTLSTAKSPQFFVTDPENEFTIVHNYARPNQVGVEQITKCTTQ